jgi:hypothetical protein
MMDGPHSSLDTVIRRKTPPLRIEFHISCLPNYDLFTVGTEMSSYRRDVWHSGTGLFFYFFALEWAMKAQRGSRGIAVLFL